MLPELQAIPKEEAQEQKKINRIRQGPNPFWSIFWKFLVCCAINDAGIMAYFNFVKGTTVLEGLKQLSQNRNKPVQIEKRIVAEKRQSSTVSEKEWIATEKYLKAESEKIREKEIEKGQTLYSWKGANGYREYSNIGFPSDRPTPDRKIDYY